MYNRDGQWLQGRFDNQRGAPEEMSAYALSVFVCLSKRIQIRDRRQKLAVEI